MKQRFESLDGMRGVCACMVALYHFDTLGVVSRAPLVRHAGYFVDFFFVLSGFVIAHGYVRKIRGGLPIGQFMALRLGRLYPLHLVMMLALFAVYLAALALGGQHGGVSATDRLLSLGASLLFIQIFIPGYEFAWNGVSWSIAAEFWTYLIFALGFRLPRRLLVPLAVAAVAAILGYVAALPPSRMLNVTDTALLRALAAFGLGVVAAEIGVPRFRHAGWATAVETACVLAAGTLIAVGDPRLLPLVDLAFFAFVAIFAAEAGWISRLLKARPVIVLGVLSYSIYMVHLFVGRALFTLLRAAQAVLQVPLVVSAATLPGERSGDFVVAGPWWFGDLASAAMLAAAMLAAWVTYRTVEAPWRRWSRAAAARQWGAPASGGDRGGAATPLPELSKTR